MAGRAWELSSTVTMRQEDIDLQEKIERCERLAQWLTDDEMRQALEELAEDYKARLKRRAEKPFMLRSEDRSDRSDGGSAAGAR